MSDNDKYLSDDEFELLGLLAKRADNMDGIICTDGFDWCVPSSSQSDRRDRCRICQEIVPEDEIEAAAHARRHLQDCGLMSFL